MPKFFDIPTLCQHTGKDRSTINRAIKAAPADKLKPIKQAGVRGVRLTEKDAKWLVSFYWPQIAPIQGEEAAQ